MSPLPFLVDAARSAVLLGLALAAMPLLRRAPASTRRLVLVLALAAAALVPLASRVVPSWRVLPVAELVATGEPFAEPVGEVVTPPLVGPAPGIVIAAAAAPVVVPTRSFQWSLVLVAVWGLGALVVLARLAMGLWQARGMARRALPLWHRGISAAVAEAGVGAQARVRVRVSHEIDVPAVTGVLSAVVLVPRAALGWSEARFRAVMLHELAHVRQRDCLAQIVGQIACAMHWFNPLVWLAARRLRLERELAADERVLSAGTRPTEYAEHLLAIARSAVQSREMPGGALGMAEPSQLLSRVQAIVRPRAAALHTSRARRMAITGAVGALLGTVACVTAGDGGAPPETAPAGSAPAVAASSFPTGPSSVAVATGPLVSEVAGVLGVPAAGVELTINPEIQAIVDEEMKGLEARWHPLAATAIVLDPATGEVVALSGAATAAAPRASGSTMKSLTIAAALEEKVVAASDRFFCDKGARAYGDKTLRDASPNEWLDVPHILMVSSNIGTSRIFDKLGGAPLGRWMTRFHLGQVNGLQLRGAQSVAIPAIADGTLAGAAVAFGQFAVIASPMQMAAAYATIANDGVYNAPTLARRAVGADGRVVFRAAAVNERVLRSETARAVMEMLGGVVDDDQGTGKAARVEGVRVAGKTGTAEDEASGLKAGEVRRYASFVGAIPADKPRFVILVGAVMVVDEKTSDAVGGKVAAPVFARIAARALAH